MARFNWVCSDCDKEVGRDKLLAKTVMFREIGPGGQLVLTRTVSWLCPDCTIKDVDWCRNKHDAPGQKNRIPERAKA